MGHKRHRGAHHELIASDKEQAVHDLINEAQQAFRDACFRPRGASGARLIALMYEYTDKISAHFNGVTCSKGCPHCCNVPIVMTLPEAEFIEFHTGHKITNRHPRQRKKGIGAPWCVFLKNGECSIYAYRPYVCRTFFSLDDPKLCESGKEHALISLVKEGQGGFEYFNYLYQAIIIEAMMVQHKELQYWGDVRQFFDKLPPGNPKNGKD